MNGLARKWPQAMPQSEVERPKKNRDRGRLQPSDGMAWRGDGRLRMKNIFHVPTAIGSSSGGGELSQ